MRLLVLSKEEWDKMSEEAHLICFDEVRPKEINRYDFALLVEDEGIPQCYMTCREYASDTVYMAYGGAFPSAKGTIKSFAGYRLMISFLMEKYERAVTLIENTNLAMLKFALKAGLLVVGTSMFKNKIYLELSLSKGEV